MYSLGKAEKGKAGNNAATDGKQGSSERPRGGGRHSGSGGSSNGMEAASSIAPGAAVPVVE